MQTYGQNGPKIKSIKNDKDKSVSGFCLYHNIDTLEFRKLNPTVGAIIKKGKTILLPPKINPQVSDVTSFTNNASIKKEGKASKRDTIPNKKGDLSISQDSLLKGELLIKKDSLLSKKGNATVKKDSLVKPRDTTTVYRESIAEFSEPRGKYQLFRQIIFRDKIYFAYEVDPHKYKIELFNKTKNGKSVYNFSAIEREKKGKLLFAMNGGMYEPNLSPVGLFISEGVAAKDINLSKQPSDNFHLLPNGIFGIDSSDNAFIHPSEEYKGNKNIRLATQSGPMLVINNTYHPAFIKGSANLNIRNGVGINDKGKVIFILSSDRVNFFEFAELFKEELHCKNALYLDGAISQIYVPSLEPNGPRPGPSLGPILTVSEK
ncbi:hypothetical protein GCM10028805_55610 [Spirosoma harenae]